MAFSNINPLYPLPAAAMVSGTSTPVASQSITVSTVAVATTDYASTVDVVTFDVQTSAVRARWDGTAPTSTVGHLLPIGGGYAWSRAQWNAAQFIRDTSASGDAIVFASPMQT
jgi:hypothetical protein